jgi:hypothetical protein
MIAMNIHNRGGEHRCNVFEIVVRQIATTNDQIDIAILIDDLG